MKKFILTENEKQTILSMYGLLSEQSITLPQVVNGSFGSDNPDSAHNLKELETKLNSLLPQIYNNGYNPKITSASIKIKNLGGNNFITSYSVTVSESNDGKAWMGFTSRGSIGARYVERADGQITGSENIDGRSLIDKLKSIGADDIEYVKGTPIVDDSSQLKQYFVQFTKPTKYPPHQKTNNTTNQNSSTTIKGNSFEEIRNNIKKLTNLSIDNDKVETTLINQPFQISLPKGNNTYKSFSFIYDPSIETLDNRVETIIKPQNPNMEIIKSGQSGQWGWKILGFK